MNRYQLGEKNNYRFGSPLLVDNSQSIMIQDNERTCTDTICAILMFLAIAAFIGLLIFGIVTGDFFKIVAIHNSDKVRCDTLSDYKYGYLPNFDVSQKAVCVKECPAAVTAAFPCLTDSVTCLTGTFAASYASFALDIYCVPIDVSKVSIESIFQTTSYEAWVYDLQTGWVVLLLAAGAAIILSLMFFVFVRICAGPIIWLAIVIAIGGIFVIGLFFVLQAKGVTVSSYVSDRLSNFTYDQLLTIGISALGASALLLFLVICLRSRLAMGAKAVQLGSIFLCENCCLVILPISQIILVFLTIIAIIFGAGYLYSRGTQSYPDFDAFPTISLTDGQKVMEAIFLATGLWVIFFFHGCNHFMLCSSVASWYFNQQSPCGSSLWRLVRFHSGSVALTSLINGIFFVFKLLAHILNFEVKDEDSTLVSCFLKCLNALFCIFQCFLRFLSDGTYVQIAISARGYCYSTFRAFDLIADNVIKVSITDGLSVFFTIFGILGVTASVAVAAYFSVLRVPFYQQRISSPFVVTFISGIIAFVISTLYLSMIDVSASSVLQCFLTDRESGNGHALYANEQVKSVLMDQ